MVLPISGSAGAGYELSPSLANLTLAQLIALVAAQSTNTLTPTEIAAALGASPALLASSTALYPYDVSTSTVQPPGGGAPITLTELAGEIGAGGVTSANIASALGITPIDLSTQLVTPTGGAQTTLGTVAADALAGGTANYVTNTSTGGTLAHSAPLSIVGYGSMSTASISVFENNAGVGTAGKYLHPTAGGTQDNRAVIQGAICAISSIGGVGTSTKLMMAQDIHPLTTTCATSGLNGWPTSGSGTNPGQPALFMPPSGNVQIEMDRNCVIMSYANLAGLDGVFMDFNSTTDTLTYNGTNYTTRPVGLKLKGGTFAQFGTTTYADPFNPNSLFVAGTGPNGTVGGRIFSLLCDEMEFDDVTVLGWGQGVAFDLGGNWMKFRRCKAFSSDGQTSSGGMRFIGGDDAFVQDFSFSTGDDGCQIVPEYLQLATGPGTKRQNLSCTNFIICDLNNCQSASARAIIVALNLEVRNQSYGSSPGPYILAQAQSTANNVITLQPLTGALAGLTPVAGMGVYINGYTPNTYTGYLNTPPTILNVSGNNSTGWVLTLSANTNSAVPNGTHVVLINTTNYGGTNTATGRIQNCSVRSQAAIGVTIQNYYSIAPIILDINGLTIDCSGQTSGSTGGNGLGMRMQAASGGGIIARINQLRIISPLNQCLDAFGNLPRLTIANSNFDSPRVGGLGVGNVRVRGATKLLLSDVSTFATGVAGDQALVLGGVNGIDGLGNIIPESNVDVSLQNVSLYNVANGDVAISGLYCSQRLFVDNCTPFPAVAGGADTANFISTTGNVYNAYVDRNNLLNIHGTSQIALTAGTGNANNPVVGFNNLANAGSGFTAIPPAAFAAACAAAVVSAAQANSGTIPPATAGELFVDDTRGTGSGALAIS